METFQLFGMRFRAYRLVQEYKRMTAELELLCTLAEAELKKT